MTSSASYDFSVSRDDIIKDALLELGVLESGESPTADETTDCARRLNQMVKLWATKGYLLHAVQDVALFLVAAQQSYALGNATTDAEWCAWDDYAQTTLSAAAASGATSLSLTAATGFATADRIGVVLDSGVINWSALTLLAGTTATVPAIAGAAASGNVVFGYTSRIVRPLRVVRDSIYRRDITNSDIPVELVAKTEYDLMSGKTQSGKIIKAAYQPFLTSGRLWTWPCADLATDVLRFTIERPIQDFDSTGDTPDLPIEAAKALYLNLAADVAGMFDAADEIPRLRAPDGESGTADQALQDWLNFSRENASVRLQPDMRR